MRRVNLILLVAMLGGGCAAHAAFKPETIDIDGHQLVIKGWSHEGRFCIELKLRPGDKVTSLHRLALVRPDGKKLEPHTWQDKTPEPPRISVGFGVGGIGGGEGEGEGGLGGGMGMSFPLGGGKASKVTDLEACWKLADAAAEITDCTLEVSVVSVVIRRATVTTVPLAMAVHRDEEPKSQTQPRDKAKDEPSAKDLVREIDFTQKGPPKKSTQTI